jgi:hypothetical protein
MVEAGPVVSDPPGTNVKNIADPAGQAAARTASQGDAASGVAGLGAGLVVEGTVTARHGTHRIGRAADGSAGMPAAAAATCVGGQGAHWTCATPRFALVVAWGANHDRGAVHQLPDHLHSSRRVDRRN